MEYITIALAFLLGIFIGRELTKNRLDKVGEVALNPNPDINWETGEVRQSIKVLKKKEPLDYAVESALAIEKGKGLFSFFKK